MKYRIRKYDSLNWVVEAWTEGSRNQKTGLKGPDHWVIRGYYNRLRHIPDSLIDMCLGDTWKGGKLKEALEEATATCIAALQEVLCVASGDYLSEVVSQVQSGRRAASRPSQGSLTGRLPWETLEDFLRDNGLGVPEEKVRPLPVFLKKTYSERKRKR